MFMTTQEDIENSRFYGKRIGDMDRLELLRLIAWMHQESEKLLDQRCTCLKRLHKPEPFAA